MHRRPVELSRGLDTPVPPIEEGNADELRVAEATDPSTSSHVCIDPSRVGDLRRVEARASPLPAAGTQVRAGRADGLTVNVAAEGPATRHTPLQIACVFEYVEGDLTTPPALPAAANGMLHLDQSLQGLITTLRRSGRFAGHELETLLITPPKGLIPADRLLLVGLGNRNAFTTSVLQRVGAVGMREALRLRVGRLLTRQRLEGRGHRLRDRTLRRGGRHRCAGGARHPALPGEQTLQRAAPSVATLTLLAGPRSSPRRQPRSQIFSRLTPPLEGSVALGNDNALHPQETPSRRYRSPGSGVAIDDIGQFLPGRSQGHHRPVAALASRA